MPVVIGAPGSVNNETWIKKLGIAYNIGVMEKTVLLGTARILRKGQEIWRSGHSVSLWSFVTTHPTEELTAISIARTQSAANEIILILPMVGLKNS